MARTRGDISRSVNCDYFLSFSLLGQINLVLSKTYFRNYHCNRCMEFFRTELEIISHVSSCFQEGI